MAKECLVPDGCTWPIVLGVDPGTHVMGYGAVVLAPDGPRLLTAGVLRARTRDAPHLRLGQLATALEDVLDQSRPTTVVIEPEFPRVVMVWQSVLPAHHLVDVLDKTVVREKPYV